MRILFIHGFGENEAIFSKIAPFIAGEHVFVNVWRIVGDAPRPNLNVLDFAKEVIQKYTVTKNDVIIGHSMGGWIAYHIKHVTGSPIVQIASWTDSERIVSPFKNLNLMFWLVRNGLVFNRFMKWLYNMRGYKGKPSQAIYEDTFDRLRKGNKENVLNQLRLNFMPVPDKLTAIPDLRIHALADLIILKPKEAFHEVIGDHFTLYTHPEKVYKPIADFLAVKMDNN